MKNILYKTILIITAIIGFQFCSESINENIHGNLPPNTNLFLFTNEEISQQPSRLQLHWWGDDPDGLISGFYFKWEGLNEEWIFTTKNDSIFSLPIGSADTTFKFLISAADNQGNGKYDNLVQQNGINYGPEPFFDSNKNGVWDEGETFIDIGLIDPSPAEQLFPIKNSPPVLEWSEASSLPLESFPAITIGWNATDIDGDESITELQLALNDTSGFVSLPGNTRLVTLRIADLNAVEPEMEILLGADENNILSDKLPKLQLNSNNRIYLRAKDISGSFSKVITLPDTSREWFVKKPKGNLLIIDDLAGTSGTSFYNDKFDSLANGALKDKYDIFDLESTLLPFPNISFLETIKLFDFVYWYSDSSPNLTFANIVTQKFINAGGKIFYSMTFEIPSENFAFDLATIQNFLPVDALGEEKPVSFLLRDASVLPANPELDYPQLKTTSTIGFVRTFVPSVTAMEIYDISSSQINGNIALLDNSRSIFFIGLPLHSADGIKGNVKTLLEKVFFEEFGLTP